MLRLKSRINIPPKLQGVISLFVTSISIVAPFFVIAGLVVGYKLLIIALPDTDEFEDYKRSLFYYLLCFALGISLLQTWLSKILPRIFRIFKEKSGKKG